MGKLPSFQFYPGDWMKDPALRAVSSGARGLWMDMLCLMHEGTHRGYLQHSNGQPHTIEQIARMTGNLSVQEVEGWIAELENCGVFSRSAAGVIYCRRILRDENKRRACREAGKRGGNPALLQSKDLAPTLKGADKGEDKGIIKGDIKGDANPEITPSSSSSSSEVVVVAANARAREESGQAGPQSDIAPVLQVVREVFDRLPPPYGQDLILQEVTDLALWRQVCVGWRATYSDTPKVAKLLEMYRQGGEKQRHGQNSIGTQNGNSNGKYTAAERYAQQLRERNYDELDQLQALREARGGIDRPGE